MNKLVFRILGAAVIVVGANVSVSAAAKAITMFVTTSRSGASTYAESGTDVYLENEDGLDHTLNISYSYSSGFPANSKTVTLREGTSYRTSFEFPMIRLDVYCYSHSHSVGKIYLQ
ncbi:hypothetical protein MCEGE11_00102 [Sphingomonadaceae bacterium]|jgi:hypothetical protein